MNSRRAWPPIAGDTTAARPARRSKPSQAIVVRIYVTNRLPEPTTVHWHGIRIINGMDGVNGLTQEPIPPGETFRYEFVVPDAGTFMYHPHFDEMTQQALGMMGMFIVHPRQRQKHAGRSRLRHHAQRMAHRSRHPPAGHDRNARLQYSDYEQQGLSRHRAARRQTRRARAHPLRQLSARWIIIRSICTDFS